MRDHDSLMGLLAKKHVAIVGMGNRLRGDDGAGPILVDLIRGKCVHVCFDAGVTPENYTSYLAHQKLDVIVIVDAVNMAQVPGVWRLLHADDLEGIGYSTHDVPLPLLMFYLQATTGAHVVLLGIQPQCVAFGSEVSPAVRASLEQLADYCTGGITLPS